MSLYSSTVPNTSDKSNLTPAENQLHSSISHDSTLSYLGTSLPSKQDSTVLGVSNASVALYSYSLTTLSQDSMVSHLDDSILQATVV